MGSPPRRRRLLPAALLVALFALLGFGCGADDDDDSSGTAGSSETSDDDGDSSGTTGSSDSSDDDTEELFPDVVAATAEQSQDGSWAVAATLSSPYDSAERYADAWRVLGPDGEVYGIRELAHDHASEQPFTRSQSGIAIPDDVTTVTVQGRDQVSGWGGATVEIELGR